MSKTDEYVPKYSIKMGRFRQDRKHRRLEHPDSHPRQGKIPRLRVSAVLAKLVKDAEDWIHNEAQYREDEIIDEKVRKEEKGTKKYEQPKGLSALGKMDAAKRQVSQAAKPAEQAAEPKERRRRMTIISTGATGNRTKTRIPRS